MPIVHDWFPELDEGDRIIRLIEGDGTVRLDGDGTVRPVTLPPQIYIEETDDEDETNGYTTAEDSLYICETCGIGSDEHQHCCDGCGDFHYCSRECQRQHWDNVHRDQCNRCNVHTRRRFNTPCGQTYWVDEEYWLYTNRRVEFPIGYWCVDDQCVYLNDGDDSSDEDDDDYTPPPTPPPMYQESSESAGSERDTPPPLDSDEVEGEVIMLGQSEC